MPPLPPAASLDQPQDPVDPILGLTRGINTWDNAAHLANPDDMHQ